MLNILKRYVLSLCLHFFVLPFLPVSITIKVVKFLYAQLEIYKVIMCHFFLSFISFIYDKYGQN